MITEQEINRLAHKEARLYYSPKYSKDDYHSCILCFEEGFNQAIELTQQKWIPVAERFPDVQVPVLVYLPKYGTPNINTMWIEEMSGQWFNTAWQFKRLDEVTHWMPLPEVPKQ